MWPCTTVLGNALGDVYICGSLRVVEKVKICVEVFHVNHFRYNINHSWQKNTYGGVHVMHKLPTPFFSKRFPLFVLRKALEGYKNVKSKSIIYKRNGQGKDGG